MIVYLGMVEYQQRLDQEHKMLNSGDLPVHWGDTLEVSELIQGDCCFGYFCTTQIPAWGYTLHIKFANWVIYKACQYLFYYQNLFFSNWDGHFWDELESGWWKALWY